MGWIRRGDSWATWALTMLRAAFYTATRPGLPGIYNRLVRWLDRGPYSHCELIFSDGMAASSSFMDGGVRFKYIEFDPVHWDFVPLPDDLEAAARIWFEDHQGQAYDLWGNARFLLGLLRDSSDKWFCSESIAAALDFIDPWRFGPNGLAAIFKTATQHPPG